MANKHKSFVKKARDTWSNNVSKHSWSMQDCSDIWIYNHIMIQEDLQQEDSASALDCRSNHHRTSNPCNLVVQIRKVQAGWSVILPAALTPDSPTVTAMLAQSRLPLLAASDFKIPAANTHAWTWKFKFCRRASRRRRRGFFVTPRLTQCQWVPLAAVCRRRLWSCPSHWMY